VDTLAITGTDAGDFAILSEDCSGAEIAPDESCTVDLVFTPSCEGAKNAALEIGSNAGSDQVSLSGTGQTAQDGLRDLIEAIKALGLHHGTQRSLIAKAEAAIRYLDEGDVASACDVLGALINEVEAQSGNKIKAPDATDLIELTEEIRAAIGCDGSEPPGGGGSC
jgi:hypothetical protein